MTGDNGRGGRTRVTVSLPPELYEESVRNAKAVGRSFSSFTAYALKQLNEQYARLKGKKNE